MSPSHAAFHRMSASTLPFRVLFALLSGERLWKGWATSSALMWQYCCYWYRLELSGRKRRLTWEAMPRSIHDGIQSAINNSDCLVFDTNIAHLFADNGNLGINVTINMCWSCWLDCAMPTAPPYRLCGVPIAKCVRSRASSSDCNSVIWLRNVSCYLDCIDVVNVMKWLVMIIMCVAGRLMTRLILSTKFANARSDQIKMILLFLISRYSYTESLIVRRRF